MKEMETIYMIYSKNSNKLIDLFNLKLDNLTESIFIFIL